MTTPVQISDRSWRFAVAATTAVQGVSRMSPCFRRASGVCTPDLLTGFLSATSWKALRILFVFMHIVERTDSDIFCTFVFKNIPASYPIFGNLFFLEDFQRSI